MNAGQPCGTTPITDAPQLPSRSMGNTGEEHLSAVKAPVLNLDPPGRVLARASNRSCPQVYACCTPPPNPRHEATLSPQLLHAQGPVDSFMPWPWTSLLSRVPVTRLPPSYLCGLGCSEANSCSSRWATMSRWTRVLGDVDHPVGGVAPPGLLTTRPADHPHMGDDPRDARCRR
jgi:hypothetical protein